TPLAGLDTKLPKFATVDATVTVGTPAGPGDVGGSPTEIDSTATRSTAIRETGVAADGVALLKNMTESTHFRNWPVGSGSVPRTASNVRKPGSWLVHPPEGPNSFRIKNGYGW